MTHYTTARFERHQTIYGEWERSPAPFFTGGPVGVFVLAVLRFLLGAT